MDKKRNPALVIIFSFISFGIYFLWWSGKLQADIKEKQVKVRAWAAILLACCLLVVFIG